MAQIAAQMAAARPDGLLLVAQSNAGLPQVVGDHFEYDATPDDMARHAAELREIGIDLIGACCGSTPDARRRDAPRPGDAGVTDGAVVGEDGVARCPWAATPGTMRDYHDTEWGVPVRDERGLFERLCLEGFQAGLSWSTILNKRERFREVFHGFDVDRVAAMTDADVERLLQDAGIVRNRAKILATRKNAVATIDAAGRRWPRGFIAASGPTRPRAARARPRCRPSRPSRGRCPRRCASAASASSDRPRCTR